MSSPKTFSIEQTGFVRALAVILLFVSSLGYAQMPTFSENVMALQGVWALDAAEEGPIMARLVVHGDYFLLIYQWPKNDARVVEIKGFKADGEKIRDKDGKEVLSYIMTGAKTLHFEVIDESPDATSKYREFGMKRIGLLPDLNLRKPPVK